MTSTPVSMARLAGINASVASGFVASSCIHMSFPLGAPQAAVAELAVFRHAPRANWLREELSRSEADL